jgi:hypothetical protein
MTIWSRIRYSVQDHIAGPDLCATRRYARIFVINRAFQPRSRMSDRGKQAGGQALTKLLRPCGPPLLVES